MKSATLIVRLYRWIAQAFPETFFRAHGDDLVFASEEMIQETAAREGVRGLLRMVPRLLLDLLRSITVEYASEIRQDLSYAMRNLRHQKIAAITAIVSLSFGISTVTVSYSQLESTMLRDVPEIRDPDRVVAVQSSISYPDYEKLRDGSHGQLESVAAYLSRVPVMLRIAGSPERIFGHIVSENYFSTLGASASFGRLLGNEDGKGAAPSIVISHWLWREKFGANPQAIGQRAHVNGQLVTIVGVTSKDFRGASPMTAVADIFLPVRIGSKVMPELGNDLLEKRIASFTLIGRLAPGVESTQAEAALDTQMRTIEKEANDPGKDRPGRRITLTPGGKIFPVRKEDLAMWTGMPLALMGLMLWIACANVATMILAKALERRKEIAIRLSLGASRARLIRQLLTESILLSVIGGTLGIVWAYWQTGTLDAFKPIMPGYFYFQTILSWRALLLTLAVSVLTGIFAGLTPALEATKTDLTNALKGTVAPNRVKWWGSRNMLVMQQVAASLMLLLITSWVVIGFNRGSSMDVGFDSAHLYRFSIDPIRDGYSDEKTLDLVAHLQERLAATPGVVNAALSVNSPLNIGQNVMNLKMRTNAADQQDYLHSTRLDRIGPDFFHTLRVPILHGREFTRKDRASGNLVVVNEEMVRQFWPGQEPIGQVTEIDGKPHQVIGVVRDLRSGTLLARTFPSAFILMGDPDYLKPRLNGFTLTVRAQPGFDAIKNVQQAIHVQDPNLTVFSSAAVDTDIVNSLSMVRMISYTYGAMGLYGLLLAAIGLAGVTAQAVARRTKEIGIRIALGARGSDILQLVLREGMVLTIVGAGFGVAGAFGIVRILSAYFNALADVTQTSLSDPLLIAGAPLLLCILALIACFWPAAQSVRIDPMTAIREE